MIKKFQLSVVLVVVLNRDLLLGDVPSGYGSRFL